VTINDGREKFSLPSLSISNPMHTMIEIERDGRENFKKYFISLPPIHRDIHGYRELYWGKGNKIFFPWPLVRGQGLPREGQRHAGVGVAKIYSHHSTIITK
jgi:hypothetical protein